MGYIFVKWKCLELFWNLIIILIVIFEKKSIKFCFMILFYFRLFYINIYCDCLIVIFVFDVNYYRIYRVFFVFWILYFVIDRWRFVSEFEIYLMLYFSCLVVFRLK